MKANSWRCQNILKYGGQNVLTAVLLHVVKSSFPVKDTPSRANLQWGWKDVKDIFVLLLHGEDFDSVQYAFIKRLSATFRIK